MVVKASVLGVLALLLTACGWGEADPGGNAAPNVDLASDDRNDVGTDEDSLPDSPSLVFQVDGITAVSASPSWVAWPAEPDGTVEMLSEMPNTPEPRGSLTAPVGSVVTVVLPISGDLEFEYRTAHAHQLLATEATGEVMEDGSVEIGVPDEPGSYILEAAATIPIDHPEGPFLGRLRYATRVVALPVDRECSSTRVASAFMDTYGWLDADGCPVDIEAVQTFRPGREFHCSHWPPSIRILAPGATERRDHLTYTRDPEGVLGGTALSAGFDPEAQLPPDAVDTGYRQGTGVLYRVPDDTSAIYLDFGDTVEMWPLDPELVACI